MFYESEVRKVCPNAHVVTSVMGGLKYRIEDASATRRRRPLGPWCADEKSAWLAAHKRISPVEK